MNATYDLTVGCDRFGGGMARHAWDGVHVLITDVDAAPVCSSCAQRWETIIAWFRERGTPLHSFRVEYAHPIMVTA